MVFLIGARLSAEHPVRSFQDLGGNRGMRHMLDYLMRHAGEGTSGLPGRPPEPDHRPVLTVLLST